MCARQALGSTLRTRPPPLPPRSPPPRRAPPIPAPQWGPWGMAAGGVTPSPERCGEEAHTQINAALVLRTLQGQHRSDGKQLFAA